MSRIARFSLKLSQDAFIFLVEKVSLSYYMLIFVVSVAVFAGAYTYLTPLGHGVGQNLTPISQITFFEGVYFSVITISSLGYGDMHPVGISKVLACVEVLMGLGLIGVMIAKVTSQRLSYHVSHLFSSNVQERLHQMAAGFEQSQAHLKTIMPQLAAAYQMTPRSDLQPYQPSLLSEFQRIIVVFSQYCIASHEVFVTETDVENVFQSVPAKTVVRLGNSIDEAFMVLVQLILSLSTQARIEILAGENRRHIFQAIDSQRRLCALARDRAIDRDTLDAFQRVKETCDRVSASYFVAPEELQPDQVASGLNEPQQN